MNSSPEVSCISEENYEMVWEEKELVVNEKSVFQVIRGIKDPEHDYTLEQLKVVGLERIKIVELNSEENSSKIIEIEIVPTIPHCSMVGLIGLSIIYKLGMVVSSRYVVRVVIKKGTHMLEEDMTKQLEDLERTESAFLNPAITDVISMLI